MLSTVDKMVGGSLLLERCRRGALRRRTHPVARIRPTLSTALGRCGLAV